MKLYLMGSARICVAGSRGFADYDLLCRKLDVYLSRLVRNGTLLTFISGGAVGADELGERYAKSHAWPFERFFADWERYGKAAGPRRNKRMAATSTHLVAFWDGQWWLCTENARPPYKKCQLTL